MVNKQTAKKWAIGAVVAALAGYITGILTAPKSGKETRKDIKDTAHKSIVASEERLQKLQEELGSLTKSAKDKSAKLTSKAKEEFNSTLGKASTAKDKAKEVFQAVKNGNADDKDLQKAVNEATKAVSHFKNYLDKI